MLEQIFNYETAKHTLVLSAYTMLIMFDIWWVGYLICSSIKWVAGKIRSRFGKPETAAEKENTDNE